MVKLPRDHVAEIGRMLYEWFPSETIRAENRYALYALDVYGLLRDGEDDRRLASYLGRAHTTEMGLPPDPDADQETARQLVQWWERQS